MSDLVIRRGTQADTQAAYAVFRESIWDYSRRLGLVAPDDENDIDASWIRQKSTVEHVRDTAAEFWVAESDHDIVGFARSIERRDVLQLTEFFVHPRSQSRGVGRKLLDRAFPIGRGRHRSILATQNGGALALYLRYDVSFQSTLADFSIDSGGHAYTSDLEFVSVDDLDDPLPIIDRLDSQLLDHTRREDIEFLIANRPGFLYRRDRSFVGYGFESNGTFAGPFLTQDSTDLSAALSHAENSAADAELGRFDILLSLDAHDGLDWMLTRRHRMSAFFVALLGSDAFIPRDRYVPMGPPFFF